MNSFCQITAVYEFLVYWYNEVFGRKMNWLLRIVLACSFAVAFSEDCEPGTCQSGETCCPAANSGEFSCCPSENAVCCPYRGYCCPQGTECDVVTGTCHDESSIEDGLQNLDKLEKRRGGIDDNENELKDDCKPGACDFGETCCPTAIPGDYSCCPYSNAVCCEDHTFCCPENTECDVIKGTCIPKESVGNKLEKRQGILDEERNLEQQCGDGSYCGSGTTCCVTKVGKYGCCPYLEAKCCPDKIHCCPFDQVCDVTSRYCIGKQTVQESAGGEPALSIDLEDSA